MIVDDGVQVRRSGARRVGGVARQARCRDLVSASLLPTDESMPASIGNVAEFGDIDVDQRPGIGMFVAAQGSPVTRSRQDRRLRRQRTSTACTVEAGIDKRPAIWTGPSRCRHRSAAIRRITDSGVVFGLVWPRAAVGHARDAFGAVAVGSFLGGACCDHEHFRDSGVGPAVVDDHPCQSQAGDWGQCCVSVGHEGLRVVKRFLDSSTSQPEAFACQLNSPRFPEQHPWTSHLICRNFCQEGRVRRLPGSDPGRRLFASPPEPCDERVDRATRGQTDIRGLDTAGRDFGWIASASLASSVDPGRPAHRCIPGRSTRCHHRTYGTKQSIRRASAIHHRQRPAPPRQLASDRGIRDDGAFAAFEETHPALVQPAVPFIAAGAGCGRGPVPP